MYLKSLTGTFTSVVDTVDVTVNLFTVKLNKGRALVLVAFSYFRRQLEIKEIDYIGIVFIPVIMSSSDWDHSGLFFLVHG